MTAIASPGEGEALPRPGWPRALLAPVAIREFDLSDPPSSLRLMRPVGHPPYRTLMVLARVDRDPLGIATFPLNSHSLAVAEVQRELGRWFTADLNQARSGLPTAAAEPNGSSPTRPGQDVEPSVTVVVVTCCNVDPLERCLRSILRSDYGNFEVIVVENRPDSSDTQWMLETHFGDESRVRYVEEPRRGASYARNAGLERAVGQILAFADDDVLVDPGWIKANVEALTGGDAVACCTGLILPLELETQSQVMLEQFASFGKGFVRRTYRLSEPRPDDPRLPYAVGSIGSGASVAVTADAVRALGGFDTSLGPGTPTTGAEDLDLLARLLSAGHAVAYEPRAIVWHQHPEGVARLRRLAFRYGVGLGSMLTKQLIRGPERGEMLRAVPVGLRYLSDPNSRKNRGRPPDLPRELVWRERAGMVLGPAAYLSSLFVTRLRSLESSGGRSIGDRGSANQPTGNDLRPQ
jgi:GT2 family glycosyltransferase